jgi:hypothetical protein
MIAVDEQQLLSLCEGELVLCQRRIGVKALAHLHCSGGGGGSHGGGGGGRGCHRKAKGRRAWGRTKGPTQCRVVEARTERRLQAWVEQVEAMTVQEGVREARGQKETGEEWKEPRVEETKAERRSSHTREAEWE